MNKLRIRVSIRAELLGQAGVRIRILFRELSDKKSHIFAQTLGKEICFIWKIDQTSHIYMFKTVLLSLVILTSLQTYLILNHMIGLSP